MKPLHVKILQISRDLVHLPQGRNKHFSFLVIRNKILNMGWNHSWRTHPIAARFGHRFNSIHSELSCILPYKNKPLILNNAIVINVHLNKMGDVKLAKPCPCCVNMLMWIGINKVEFTTDKGTFDECKIG